MANRERYPAEVRERAVRPVAENVREHGSQWKAIVSVAEKLRCSREALRRWGRQFERDTGKREGLSTDERTRM